MEVDVDASTPSQERSAAREAIPDDDPGRTPSKPLSRALLTAIAGLFGATTLGAALSPYLAVEYPLILLALTPWPRHVILVAPHTPLIPLVLVVSLRGLCACVVAFEVGRHYGPQGIALFERRSPRLAGFARAFERVFARAAGPLIVFSPGPLTSTLAAISGKSRVFSGFLSWLGFVIWACINYQVGDWLKPWTGPILAFVQRYLLETTVACAVLVLGYQWFTRKRRLRQVR